jgi:hypothetical protein
MPVSLKVIYDLLSPRTSHADRRTADRAGNAQDQRQLGHPQGSFSLSGSRRAPIAKFHDQYDYCSPPRRSAGPAAWPAGSSRTPGNARCAGC